METSVTSILQQLRALEELVIHHRMTTEELHGLELELRTIVERLDAIRILAKDLKQIPKLTAEDTKRLDKLEETLKDSVKKTLVIRAEWTLLKMEAGDMTLLTVLESPGLVYVQ